jgi:hypothetical protein
MTGRVFAAEEEMGNRRVVIPCIGALPRVSEENPCKTNSV